MHVIIIKFISNCFLVLGKIAVLMETLQKFLGKDTLKEFPK